MTYTVSAKLSNGMTLTATFLSKATAERAAANFIADHTAEGVSVAVTITELAQSEVSK